MGVNPASGGIAPVALGQLAAWQQVAANWPLCLDTEEGHLRCVADDQSVVPLVDGTGTGYRYTRDDLLALMVAHLRQAHPEMGPGA